MFASRAGLGFLLMAYGGSFDLGRIFVVILLVFGLALGSNGLLFFAERLLMPGRSLPGK